MDRGLNGDDDPHLFVFHWIDGVRTCYNACGFVPFNEPGYSAGMKLPVTTTPTQFNILHHGAEWRVGYNGHWVGAFPDSEWGNRFKVAGLVQWFGEVSSPTASSCTEMGNGQPAGSATAARIERIGFAPARAPRPSPPSPPVRTLIRCCAPAPTACVSAATGPAGRCRTWSGHSRPSRTASSPQRAWSRAAPPRKPIGSARTSTRSSARRPRRVPGSRRGQRSTTCSGTRRNPLPLTITRHRPPQNVGGDRQFHLTPVGAGRIRDVIDDGGADQADGLRN